MRVDKITLGSKVFLKKESEFKDSPSNPIYGGKYGHIEGEVTNYYDGSSISVKWSNGNTNIYYASHLFLAKSIPRTHKLTKIFQ